MAQMEAEKLEKNGAAVREEDNDHEEEEEEPAAAPLMALNHISRLCRNVEKSIEFYTNVLGMVLTKRPQALENFNGAWLFNYGVGIHLVQAKDCDILPDPNHELDPMDNHISFQCEDMEAMERRLKEHKVDYKKRRIEDENGTEIEQVFFTDPDGFMIELCNCENVKLVPASSLSNIKLPMDRHVPPLDLHSNTST